MKKTEMKIIGKTKVWFVVQQLFTHNTKQETIVETDISICYYGFSKPSDIVYGELIKDEGSIMQFSSVESAVEYGIKFVREKFNL